jgi:hypothetical protein
MISECFNDVALCGATYLLARLQSTLNITQSTVRGIYLLAPQLLVAQLHVKEQDIQFVRSEILTVVKIPMMDFWVVSYVDLKVETSVLEEHTVPIFNSPEDRCSMFLRNTGIYLGVHVA